MAGHFVGGAVWTMFFTARLEHGEKRWHGGLLYSRPTRRETKAESGRKARRKTVARVGSDGWVVRRRDGLMPALSRHRGLRRMLRH